ncbi:MAG: potassium transporter TrkA [Halobacteriales archaeon]|nr:potassium transporter TrkA [Halobacteriales archaeon]
MTAVVEGIVSEIQPVEAVVAVVALAFASAVVAATVAFSARIYSREPSPGALNVLAGLGAIAVWLNLSGSLGNFIQGETQLVQAGTAFVNLASITVGSLTASYGGKLGDRAAVEFSTLSKASYDGDVTRMVRSAGRTVTVEVPDADRIEDIDGYDPVSDDTKKKLAGKRFVFPRGMTVAELHRRVTDRLKEDYEVGYVDVELEANGEVEFLGLGRGVSGIGPTLGPGTCAVAVRADPAYSSGPGDNVQLWMKNEDGTAERIASGELRATVGDVVTVALDENDAKKVSPSETYRLVTLPSEKGPERQFASMLRSADETMSVVTVTEESALVGTEIGAVAVPVVAVRAPDGEVVAVPPKARVVSEGDTLYVVGRPEELRRLDTSSATD